MENGPKKISSRNQNCFLPNLYFNKSVVEKLQTQKNLDIKLDKNLSCKDHLKHKFGKVIRGVRIFTKLNGFLSCHSLISFKNPLYDLA